MASEDVPAEVLAALDSPACEAAAVEFWTQMAAHHRARADAFTRLAKWAAEAGLPVAVQVAIGEAAFFNTAEARRCDRDAAREQQQ